MLKTDPQKRFKSSVVALALAFLPMAADAAGLGKLTVMSALGQPLRAEIELTASREEFSSLSARMASADAFKNAGVEYAVVLAGLRFTPVMRPNGQSFLLVTSERPFNEPFVDMLVEANWAAGRLVREYTFLLDPPDVFGKSALPAPVAVPEVQKPALAPATAPAAKEFATPVAPAASDARVLTPAEEKAVPKPAVGAVAKPAAGGATRTVKNGDTLAKIANEIRPDGVNLDQMLVALFRSNQDIFDAGNMNRLRAGKILTVPDKDAAVAVEKGEARKIVLAQAADFNVYRKKLAALAATAPAREDVSRQAAVGKIAPKVEDKVPPPLGKDKLEVSRTEAGKDGKLGARLSATEEDLVARDKALKEAASRIADLEKNLTNLKKLAELKSAAGTKAPEPVAEKTAEPAKPAPALAVPATPAEAPKPVQKKPLPPPPPPPPPPSFVEESPEIVFGGGGILALLLGYLGFKAWRKRRMQAAESPISMVGGDSVFATTGGHSVDSGALPTDFSQEAAVGMAADEGVDPVAEADVYIAYGRDGQAEEILLEALKTDPTRRAIHLKLLEIYAVRKSIAQFATVASDLHGLTAGAGPGWEKAAALGRSIDPTNPLYGGDPQAASQDMGASTVIMRADALQPVAPVTATEEPPAAEELVADALDFDLDLGIEPEAAAAPAADLVAPPPVEDEVMSLDFDLDLGSPAAEAAPVEAAAVEEAAAPGLDFDLGALDVPVEVEPPAPEVAVDVPAAENTDDVAALDFDFDLGEAETPVEVPAVAAAAEIPALDLSAISLELDAAPAPAPAVVEEPAADFPLDLSLDLPAVEPSIEFSAEPPMDEPVAMPVEAPAMEDDPEVATKLELAHAYEEMGDKEGARELLNEVVNEGSPAQQAAARAKLAQIG